MATTYTRRTYSENEDTKKARQALTDHAAARPEAYASDWLAQLNAAAEQILSRPDFSYDMGMDPLYHQYRDNYVNLGKQAMMDTMGQAAALTGGYGSSYGQMAGQQAYTGYLQQLNNVIPELYQLALDTYDRQGQRLYNQYGLLSDREGLDYSRYQDRLNLWQDDRDYLTDRYDTQRNYDYTEFRDTVGDDQWQAAFDEDIRRYDYEHKLGEFAGTGSGGGYGGYSGNGRKKSPEKKDEKEEKPRASGVVAQNYNPKYIVPYRNDPYRYTHESY